MTGKHGSVRIVYVCCLDTPGSFPFGVSRNPLHPEPTFDDEELEVVVSLV